MRWLALLLVCALGATHASAAPQVEIKAQTRLSLEKVKTRADGNVEVLGQLVDKLTNDGIGGQNVTIVVGTDTQAAYTDPDGKFRGVFSVVPGPLPIELRFNGAQLLEKAEPFTVVTDPSRAQVLLAIRAEESPGGIKLHLNTTVEDTPTALPVQLAIGGVDTAELKPLQTVDSNTPFLMSRKVIGGAGPKRVRATFPGDARRQQATAETTFELTSTTTTTAIVSNSNLAFEDDLEVGGTVVDQDGKPVARAAVALASGDRRLAQGATDDDGNYKFKVEAEVLAGNVQQLPHDFGIQVQADPPNSYIRASRSNPTIVKVAAPQPVPVSYTIAAFLATALAAAGFFVARAKPWQRFRKPAAPAETPAESEIADPLTGGLVTNKPGLVSTLRRPHDEGFSGVVRDTVRGRAVPDAIVRVTFGDLEHEVITGPDGTFSLERLALGEWRAEVAAPGHITEKFGVSIPHRGELRGVRIDL
ncbi:MAG: carboxypeptidase regulatory-like domain-containing protein, partial [Deltaproteobacteria bacterium]|nr:carboxypeptidase regulatory-like domain-containing protein [Deltaproteobacteria bacterium]